MSCAFPTIGIVHTLKTGLHNLKKANDQTYLWN